MPLNIFSNPTWRQGFCSALWDASEQTQSNLLSNDVEPDEKWWKDLTAISQLQGAY